VWILPGPWNSGHDLHSKSASKKMRGATQNLYTIFVDLTKTFDTVSREGLWKILAKYGCPKIFMSIMRQFFTMASVLADGSA